MACGPQALRPSSSHTPAPSACRFFPAAGPRASYTAASNQIAALSSLAALFEMLDDFELMFDIAMPGGAKTIWQQG
jgi:hypothetical protein